MKKALKLSALCILLFVIFVPIFSYAADPTIVQLNEILNAKVREIDGWDHNARILLILTVVVGLLGTLSGTLNHVSKKWAKITVTAAGVCVTIITVITNTLYPVDHRTYRKLTCDARQVIDEIRLQLVQLQDIKDKKERDKIINNTIISKFQTLTNISKNQFALTDFKPSIVSAAYAQESVPEWVTTPPKERATLYFVGNGVASEPETAERAATDYAKQNAKIYLLGLWTKSGQGQATAAIEKIIGNIADSAEVVKKFVKYSAQQKKYRYFCLLKIDTEVVVIRLRLMASQENIEIPAAFVEQIKGNNVP